jgi:3-hydroxymyristoyl/3-hydroxydecanoyl-(acyl carrier protein) dehydratase
MSFPDILTLIDAEIAQLQSARAILTGAQPKPKLGRPVGTGKKKKKRNLTPEGRARIAAAVKARWARQKKAGK